MNRDEVRSWIAGYERARRSPGTDQLAQLFTEEASYLKAPYLAPLQGLAPIARMWEAERDGPDEVFLMNSEIIAVEGDTAVARALVLYGEPVKQEYLDLWVMRFSSDGRCREFEEWPF